MQDFECLYVYNLVTPHRKEKIFGHFYSQTRKDVTRVQSDGIYPKSSGIPVGILQVEVTSCGARPKKGSIAGRFHFREPKHQNPTSRAIFLAVFPDP